MRITRDNLDELNSVLQDLEDAMEVREYIEQWLDADEGREGAEDRSEARQEIDTNLDGLTDAVIAVLSVLNPVAAQKAIT
jgi:hypothetical protein